jgi:16S rRNA G966 N2-methylase RsmD
MQNETLTPVEKEFVRSNLHGNVSTLALQLGRFPHLDAPKVLRQITGYQVMEQKVPFWYECPDLLFPASLSLEQCSSEVTARYKAELIDRAGAFFSEKVQCIADLTGGLGVDCAFLAKGREKALYIERQTQLCELAAHNFQSLGLLQIEVRSGDGVEVLRSLPDHFDLIFLDPARRDAKGGKVVALSDCEPDLTQIKPLLLDKASFVLVKLSPMLDITLALKQLPETREIHVVSVDGECKELLFLMRPFPVNEPQPAGPVIHCVNLRSNAPTQSFQFSKSQEQSADCRYTKTPGAFLYEPNASLLKAGAFSILTQSFDVRKLHPNSHLYTSDVCLPDFPGRVFSVKSFFPFHPKEWKARLAGSVKANISVRNFPNTVAEIRKKTGLKDGGEIYLFATTLYDGKKVLIECRHPFRDFT